MSGGLKSLKVDLNLLTKARYADTRGRVGLFTWRFKRVIEIIEDTFH
jgi:hypothetical protein